MSDMNFNKVKLERISTNDPVYDIEYFAKVSNPDGQKTHWERGRLLQYLIKNKHWSPLEMVTCVLYVETTRDIGRQLLRHGSFKFQEFSQRYQKVSTDLVFKNARRQDDKNRQNSIDDMGDDVHDEWEDIQCSVERAVINGYNRALEMGIAKEVARVILPEGMTLSRLYVQANFRDLYHYVNLRTANGTQKEHMDLAEKFRSELNKVAPELFPITQTEMEV